MLKKVQPLVQKELKHLWLGFLFCWKSNEFKYPELSLMARDVMSIPITSVASESTFGIDESTFSIGRRIINKYRSSLLSEYSEALLCKNDWLCGTPS